MGNDVYIDKQGVLRTRRDFSKMGGGPKRKRRTNYEMSVAHARRIPPLVWALAKMAKVDEAWVPVWLEFEQVEGYEINMQGEVKNVATDKLLRRSGTPASYCRLNGGFYNRIWLLVWSFPGFVVIPAERLGGRDAKPYFEGGEEHLKNIRWKYGAGTISDEKRKVEWDVVRSVSQMGFPTLRRTGSRPTRKLALGEVVARFGIYGKWMTFPEYEKATRGLRSRPDLKREITDSAWPLEGVVEGRNIYILSLIHI